MKKNVEADSLFLLHTNETNSLEVGSERERERGALGMSEVSSLQAKRTAPKSYVFQVIK